MTSILGKKLATLKLHALFGVAALLAFLSASCGPAEASPSQGAARAPLAPAAIGTLTVFAASSLSEVFGDMKAAFEGANPGASIAYNFAGSSALRTQLEQGAGADVFASADEAQMSNAMKSGVIDSEPVRFATNRLVVISPVERPLAALADLARPDLKLALASPGVPAGNYARQSFSKMNGKLGLPADFHDRALANLVSNETNVRQVVGKVALGEADAGVVYVTDATADEKAKLATLIIPEEVNVLAVYPIGAVKGGNEEAAHAFIGFVMSPRGQDVLRGRGFGGAP